MQDTKKILVTGAFGQIGSELVPALQKKLGMNNVIALGNKNVPEGFKGILEIADIREKEKIETIIKKYNINTVYHLVSLLSVKGEIEPSVTWDINMNGLKTILDLGVKYNLQIFWPSSIAAFGPSTPRVDTPQHTVLEPTTIYGVTKYAGEGLCKYYNIKYGLDVRSVRYPGVISWKTPPGGGTTDYAVAIFYDGLQKGEYECFVGPETTLPMMYIDDAIKATIDLMEAESSQITIRNSYNLTAISFKASDLEHELKKYIPNLKVTYNPDKRQMIANSWPMTIDDQDARRDWGWKHDFDLSRMTKDMVVNLKQKFGMKQ